MEGDPLLIQAEQKSDWPGRRIDRSRGQFQI